jgi:hypothetical protein
VLAGTTVFLLFDAGGASGRGSAAATSGGLFVSCGGAFGDHAEEPFLAPPWTAAESRLSWVATLDVGDGDGSALVPPRTTVSRAMYSIGYADPLEGATHLADVRPEPRPRVAVHIGRVGSVHLHVEPAGIRCHPEAPPRRLPCQDPN